MTTITTKPHSWGGVKKMEEVSQYFYFWSSWIHWDSACTGSNMSALVWTPQKRKKVHCCTFLNVFVHFWTVELWPVANLPSSHWVVYQSHSGFVPSPAGQNNVSQSHRRCCKGFVQSVRIKLSQPTRWVHEWPLTSQNWSGDNVTMIAHPTISCVRTRNGYSWDAHCRHILLQTHYDMVRPWQPWLSIHWTA